MPNVSTGSDVAILLVVVGDFDPVDNTLSSGNLIGPHDQQHILRCENTVLSQQVQNNLGNGRQPSAGCI